VAEFKCMLRTLMWPDSILFIKTLAAIILEHRTTHYWLCKAPS